MRRLISAVRHDLRFQARYGLDLAAFIAALTWIVILQATPEDWRPAVTPLVLFADLAILGFYFMATSMLYEKSEGTLSALVTSPLRFREYLVARLLTLTLVAVLASLAVTVTGYGLDFQALWLAAGVLLLSVLALLLGFIAVLPHHRPGAFLLPAQLYIIFLALPLLDYLGLVESRLWYLFPSQATLLLLRSAFAETAPPDPLYALLYPLSWLALLAFVARRCFGRQRLAG